MKSEEDFVTFLEKLKSYSRKIVKGIGDDCSIIRLGKNKKYVFTTDTSLLGPHFTKDYTPEEIGYKCLATNISDVASMGCIPLYAMYAITIPSMSEKWLKGFYKGSNKLLRKYKISIIGGDTTRGPLSITIQLIGIQNNKILQRDGAKVGDDIYVSGTIGNARAALLLAKKSEGHRYFRRHLVNPVPRVDLGLKISSFASSCIDISDGLAKDLKNIAISSNKGFKVEVNQIPIKSKLKDYILPKFREECILGGGEDYELCFTANNNFSRKISNISSKLKLKITKIGVITERGHQYTLNGKHIEIKSKGYDHFADS